MEKTIWTIGHSTLSSDAFIDLLKNYQIQQLIDVRTLPGSNKFPHFNQDQLQAELTKNDINYIYIQSLGGLRKGNKDSKNIAWRNRSFRNYADYMETAEFREGLDQLIAYASEKRSAIMCAEAVWWRCHRSMIADYLKSNGWQVIHILTPTSIKAHPYTSAASIINGQLSYKEIKPEHNTTD